MKTVVLLTGTISPNTNHVVHRNTEERRKEYLDAIRYYSTICPVFFIENSNYEINSDKEFMSLDNVVIQQYEPDLNSDHTIGYQEFDMIDKWMDEQQDDIRVIKVSGRYKIDNFLKVYEECQISSAEMIIDVWTLSNWAITYVFCTTVSAYKKMFMGKYRYCNKYVDIEEIFCKIIRSDENVNITFFKNIPEVNVKTAGSGKVLSSHESVISSIILRPINRWVYPKLIIYPNFKSFKENLLRKMVKILKSVKEKVI